VNNVIACRQQILALKWHLRVIQGQTFESHQKADKPLHVAVDSGLHLWL